METALRLAQTLTWKGKNPVVKLVTTTYETGIKLTKKAMNQIESQIKRLTNTPPDNFPDLGKWFIDICCGAT